MRQIAQVMSQAQGWNTTLVAELDRALVVLLGAFVSNLSISRPYPALPARATVKRLLAANASRTAATAGLARPS